MLLASRERHSIQTGPAPQLHPRHHPPAGEEERYSPSWVMVSPASWQVDLENNLQDQWCAHISFDTLLFTVENPLKLHVHWPKILFLNITAMHVITASFMMCFDCINYMISPWLLTCNKLKVLFWNSTMAVLGAFIFTNLLLIKPSFTKLVSMYEMPLDVTQRIET